MNEADQKAFEQAHQENNWWDNVDAREIWFNGLEYARQTAEPVLFAEFNEDGSFTGDASQFLETLEEPTALYAHSATAPLVRLTKDEIECARLEWCQTGWDVTEYTHAIMDMMQAKAQPALDVRELVDYQHPDKTQ